MTRAGLLDRRIGLQQGALSTAGDPTAKTWTTTRTVWAERMSKTGIERFVTSAEVAETTAAYRIRYASDVRPAWRILDGSELWDITGILPSKQRQRWLILLVERHVPGDST